MNSNNGVFLDTCVWVELLANSTPTKPHQVLQAQLASNLMKDLETKKVRIVTCEHQLFELVGGIQKAKKNDFNDLAKTDPNLGKVGSPKEIRTKYPQEFSKIIRVCKMAVSSVKKFASHIEKLDVSIDDVLNNLHLADINDYIYYKYCRDNSITLYTFDKELKAMDTDNVVVLLQP